MRGTSYQSSGTLTSSSYDTGAAADFGTISWNAAVPAGTELRFQIATNNDNATWNFKGPSGGSGTFYTSSGASIWSGHDGDRYIKYKAFFNTYDTIKTPTLHDISITYTQQTVLPTVTTGSAALVEETTATLNGNVINDGGKACQYRFEYGTSSGNYTSSTPWTGSKTTGESFSAGIISLDEGTKYYFRAQAQNSQGIASGSEMSFLTKPEDPTDFTAVASSSSQIDLSWTKGNGADRTMVRRKQGSYPTSITDGEQVYFGTGTGTSDTGLSTETTYFYSAWPEVTSGSQQQWSDGYATASATTREGKEPPPKAVGGTIYPVDKAQVLMPWIVLCLMLSLAAGGVAVGLRKAGKGSAAA